MTTTSTYASIFNTWTDEMISSSRNSTAVRDTNGNLRDLTDAEAAFASAINTEWRRRFDR